MKYLTVDEDRYIRERRISGKTAADYMAEATWGFELSNPSTAPGAIEDIKRYNRGSNVERLCTWFRAMGLAAEIWDKPYSFFPPDEGSIFLSSNEGIYNWDRLHSILNEYFWYFKSHYLQAFTITHFCDPTVDPFHYEVFSYIGLASNRAFIDAYKKYADYDESMFPHVVLNGKHYYVSAEYSEYTDVLNYTDNVRVDNSEEFTRVFNQLDASRMFSS